MSIVERLKKAASRLWSQELHQVEESNVPDEVESSANINAPILPEDFVASSVPDAVEDELPPVDSELDRDVASEDIEPNTATVSDEDTREILLSQTPFDFSHLSPRLARFLQKNELIYVEQVVALSYIELAELSKSNMAILRELNHKLHAYWPQVMMQSVKKRDDDDRGVGESAEKATPESLEVDNEIQESDVAGEESAENQSVQIQSLPSQEPDALFIQTERSSNIKEQVKDTDDENAPATQETLPSIQDEIIPTPNQQASELLDTPSIEENDIDSITKSTIIDDLNANKPVSITLDKTEILEDESNLPKKVHTPSNIDSSQYLLDEVIVEWLATRPQWVQNVMAHGAGYLGNQKHLASWLRS